MRQPLIIIYFNFKYIQNISIGTAEFYIAVLRLRRFSSVSQYIRIGESDMHRHGAEPAAVFVKIKAVTYLMTVMTRAFSFAVYQSNFYFRSFHCFTIRLSPVISAGLSRPIISSIVGQRSQSFPSLSLTSPSPITIIGTGFVV